MLNVKTDFGNYDVWFEIQKYSSNNTLALILNCDEGPFCKLTVNIDASNAITEDNKAYVDINNSPWAVDWIEENKLGEFTGIWGDSGYCTYPLFEFNMSKIREHHQ